MAWFNMQKQKTLYLIWITNTEAITKLSPASSIQYVETKT